MYSNIENGGVSGHFQNVMRNLYMRFLQFTDSTN